MLSKLKDFKLLIVILILGVIIRFYGITVNPPSLFGDEVDLGYQAYSILKTGNDYYGNTLPLNFHSLAEWRTPVYLYSAVPTVSLFGISPLGIRLPALIFGVLGILAMYLFSKELFKNQKIALFTAFVMSISPWHVQYSRAGFEVTEMLFFLIVGIYFFFKSLTNSKYLWLSTLFILITPWIYSTAKIFAPIVILLILVIWFKEILLMRLNDKLKAVIVGLLVGIPFLYGMFFTGASQRFSYISVFSDPTTEPEIGFSRTVDARARGESGVGLTPTIIDRVVHNKFVFWGERILKNYYQSFSTEFLFIKGDPNPRHSIGLGEMHRIEIIALLLGVVFLFSSKNINIKNKLFIFALLLLAPLPSALTRDGGNHATRNILMLPSMVVLVSVGWYSISTLPKRLSVASYVLVAFAYFVSLFFFSHEYLVHYAMASERWWHYGWGQSISEIKKIDSGYDRVIISMSGEPAWIFFAGYYQYNPSEWQQNFPIGNDIEVEGFGKVSHIGKFSFGSPLPDVQIYGLNRYINDKTLYLANAKEVGENLILHPEKSPNGLKLIKSIAFPSGEPAFYLFSGTKN